MSRISIHPGRLGQAQSLVVAILLGLHAISIALAQEPPSTSDLQARAFDASVLIEIVDLETRIATRDAIADALAEIGEIEELTRDTPLTTSGLAEQGVAALHRQPGQPVEIDPRLFELLTRARDYCIWSQQAHGPLGGHLYELWGKAELGPPPSLLIDRTRTADCSRLALDAEKVTATLAEDTKVNLWGFSRGYAIDRAFAILTERGATNGWVSIGRIIRAIGPGLAGNGWPMAVAIQDGDDAPTERVLLKDRALALASPLGRKLEVDGKVYAPYLSQRNGRPVEGKVAVLAATTLALDAEALAVSLFILPPREGEYRLGLLQPKPAVKWFLGSGSGTALASERGWSALKKW